MGRTKIMTKCPCCDGVIVLGNNFAENLTVKTYLDGTKFEPDTYANMLICPHCNYISLFSQGEVSDAVKKHLQSKQYQAILKEFEDPRIRAYVAAEHLAMFGYRLDEARELEKAICHTTDDEKVFKTYAKKYRDNTFSNETIENVCTFMNSKEDLQDLIEHAEFLRFIGEFDVALEAIAIAKDSFADMLDLEKETMNDARNAIEFIEARCWAHDTTPKIIEKDI